MSTILKSQVQSEERDRALTGEPSIPGKPGLPGNPLSPCVQTNALQINISSYSSYIHSD